MSGSGECCEGQQGGEWCLTGGGGDTREQQNRGRERERDG